MERQHWIDNLKIFAMFLVILGHLPIDSYYDSYIFVFHVPLFFCASGFLYKKIPFKDELKKCFSRLLIPYFCFQLLMCVILYKDAETLWRNLFGILIAENYRTEYFASPCIPLWFVAALVIIRLFRSVTGKVGVALCFVLAIILSIIFRDGIEFVWSADSALLCLPFFYLGEILRRKGHYLHYKSWLYALVLVVLLGVNVWYCALSESKVDAARFSYGNSIILYYMYNLTICFCMLGVFANYIKVRIPCFTTLNEGMILVLACHAVIGRVIMRLTPLHADILPLWMGLVVAFLSFVVLFPLVCVVRKHAKFLIGKA